MKHYIWKHFISLFLIPLLLTGCWDMKEVDLMNYAHAMGIDYKDGRYEIYVQVLDFAALSKKEDGGKPEFGAWVGKASGETIVSAIHELYATSERRIFWGHMSALIFSEDALKKGVQETLDTLTRFNEFRYTIWVFGTREPLEKILLSAPVLNLSPVYSKVSDPEETFEQSSFLQPLRLHRLISMIQEPGETPRILSIAIAPNTWEAKESKPTLRFDGVFLADIQNTNQGWLPKSKLLGIRWMNPKTRRTPLDITVDDKSAATVIFSKPDVQIIALRDQGKPKFQLKVAVRGNVVAKLEEVSETVLRQESEKIIKAEIAATFKEGVQLNTDIYNLFATLYREQPDHWKRLHEREQLRLNSDSLESIDVTTKITDEGRTSNFLHIKTE